MLAHVVGRCRDLGGWLPGLEFERLGVGPTVVLGQGLCGLTGPVGDGAMADLAAGDWKLGNRHRKAAGR